MKVILYMASSINGMIARKDDTTHWSDEELIAYMDKVKECGNMVIGRKTYELMQTDTDGDSNPEDLGNPQIVVITNKDSLKNKQKTIFIKSPKEAIEFLGNQGFEKIMVAGGAKINSAFLGEGIVDEIYLDVEPKLFGEGIPFLVPSKSETDLELLETKRIGEKTVQLHYKVIK